ncbi:hypothetical protein BH10ACT10_BH10ACT10_29700 [soil metagenome]
MTDLVDDLDTVVESACTALETVLDRDWSVPATGLTWTCRGTVEHTADDLFSYATQIAGRRPTLGGYVPFDCHSTAPAEPECAVHAEAAEGNAGLVRVLDASGGLLVAVARQADPTKRGGHPYGDSDPHGFAAMGTIETLLHVHDVAGPLGLTWEPAPDVVRRLLDRLFPEAPDGTDPWATLLQVTGRDPSTPLERWRWDGRPAAERA